MPQRHPEQGFFGQVIALCTDYAITWMRRGGDFCLRIARAVTILGISLKWDVRGIGFLPEEKENKKKK